jgi:glycogen debranching enzyme
MSTSRAPTTITEAPLISFGRDICGDLQAGLRREWLVTNGLGGYASGTLAGVNTRRYHGLLVAALAPPVGRTVLVGGSVEWAGYDGRRYPLSAHEYGGGVIDPHGYHHLESFRLEGALPVWTFAVGDARLERRVWMAEGVNATYVDYRLARGRRPMDLEITPLVTSRDFHSLTSRSGWHPRCDPTAAGVTVRWDDGTPPLSVLADTGSFTPRDDWYYNFFHREEHARGLDDRSDLFTPGSFTLRLDLGQSATLLLTAEEDLELDGAWALAAARARQLALLERAGALEADPVVQQLVLAADQFIVQRAAPGAEEGSGRGARAEGQDGTPISDPWPPAPASRPLVPPGKTVIAGYHWFNDWGRDTMIALPGLTCATGRTEDAAGILRTFARYIMDGLLPNNFPDHSGVVPGYNTVDATLWYVLAIRAYQHATGDDLLVDELLPVLRDIADQHVRGTRYHIGVDPADGLLHAGEAGIQLTWMDAKIGEWVVTPRIGKPVEINALWYNMLRTLQDFLAARRDPAATHYATLADRARSAFRDRFIHPEQGYLADVVDGPDGDDWTLRPNQIFAVSLPYPLLEGEEAQRVVDVVGRSLVASHGLRSLSPDDPAYRGSYSGDPARRDSGYHQGPVWTWLIGAYAEAYARAYDAPATARTFLAPFAHHLEDGGLGSISEILEGDEPHVPRGCVAQAWGVAEVLRVWRLLEQEPMGCDRSH